MVKVNGGKFHICFNHILEIFRLCYARHFGRIVKIIKSGMYVLTIGKKEACQDWVHIENLVQSQLLAAENLILQNGGKINEPLEALSYDLLQTQESVPAKVPKRHMSVAFSS